VEHHLAFVGVVHECGLGHDGWHVGFVKDVGVVVLYASVFGL